MSKHIDESGIYIGVLLISAATLALEISLTRVFSVAQWHHFAFMVISIGLFGFGASGSFLAVFRSLLKKDTNKMLVLFSLLFSLICIFSFLLTNQVPFDPFRLAWDSNQVLYILIYYMLLSIPFFFSGMCIALVFTKMAGKISKLYFFNLVGSAAGCIAVIYLFLIFDGPGVIIFASFTGALASLSFSLNLHRIYRLSAIAAVAVILILLLIQPPFFEIKMSPYKSLEAMLSYPGSELLFTEWNSFSRVDVINSSGVRYAPGLSIEYNGAIPEQLGLTVDGNNLNAATYYDGNPATVNFTEFLPTALVYKPGKNQEVLIIHPGGGMDVLTALHNNASSIDVVESNPIIVGLIKNKYRNFTGNLYGNEKVNVYVGDGRGFISGSNKEYDAIVLSMAGSTEASSTGVYALSENYMYTTEAFEDYYEHLSQNGTLSVTRYLLPPPREDIRMVSLGVKALENQGVEPENHTVVIRSMQTLTLLVKKEEFTRDDIEIIKKFCREKKYDLVYIPGITEGDVNIYNKFPEPYYYRMVQDILFNKTRFYDQYVFDVSPVSDDRPFFFHFFKWSKLKETYESMGKKWQPFVEGGYLVPVIFVQALILSFIFILLPMYSFKRLKKKIHGKYKILTYFLCLGMGYMFIEIALIQKFILFLGHPTYAIAIVIFSLLLCSGAGSFFSERFDLRKVIVGLSALTLIYLITLLYLFNILLGQGLFTRALISLLVISPIGFLMGIPFPWGIRIANEINKNLIPWAFCANCCASVMGSIMAVIVAMSFGFSVVFIFAGAVYLVGLGVVWGLMEKR